MDRNGKSANIPAPMQNVASCTPTNAGCLKSDTSSIGRSCRISSTTKAARRRSPPRIARLAQLAHGDRYRERADRHVDEEDPAPSERVREDAAEQGAGRDGEAD